MTIKEFKTFCEDRAAFRKPWKSLVIHALKLRKNQCKAVLRMRQDNVLSVEESALLKELENNFKSAKSELRQLCARNNISVPSFTLNEICDLYS